MTDQLDKGIKVEKEHTETIKKIIDGSVTDVNEAAKLIAKDHLKEMPDYYDRLSVLEREGKKKFEEEV
jgi:hypothetical protein